MQIIKYISVPCSEMGCEKYCVVIDGQSVCQCDPDDVPSADGTGCNSRPVTKT